MDDRLVVFRSFVGVASGTRPSPGRNDSGNARCHVAWKTLPVPRQTTPVS
jgi:hypothetical protein